MAHALCRHPVKISIHALREEGDALEHLLRHRYRYFYPRPPRGGRHDFGFQRYNLVIISIHALREEGDPLPLQRYAVK